MSLSLLRSLYLTQIENLFREYRSGAAAKDFLCGKTPLRILNTNYTD